MDIGMRKRPSLCKRMCKENHFECGMQKWVWRRGRYRHTVFAPFSLLWVVVAKAALTQCFG
jgi:hypothetical protein